LKRRNVDVEVTTQSACGGTSACSGCDKHTLHTVNSADQGDDFRAMADATVPGMERDMAHVEAVDSARF
jgi:succinate dehydrogenase / fumarate reductase flavoprotein subunit